MHLADKQQSWLPLPPCIYAVEGEICAFVHLELYLDKLSWIRLCPTGRMRVKAFMLTGLSSFGPLDIWKALKCRLCNAETSKCTHIHTQTQTFAYTTHTDTNTHTHTHTRAAQSHKNHFVVWPKGSGASWRRRISANYATRAATAAAAHKKVQCNQFKRAASAWRAREGEGGKKR